MTSVAPDRNRNAIAVMVLTIATSLVTYTATVTMLYAGIQQELALLQQTVEFHRRLADQDIMALRRQVEQLRDRIERDASDTQRTRGQR